MKLNYNLLDPKSTLKIIAVLLKFFVCNFNWMRVLSNTNISCFVSYIFKRSSIPSLTLLFCMVLVLGVGNIWGQIQLSEGFETGLPTAYTTTTSYTLGSGTWTGQSNGVIRSTTGVKSGTYSLQLRNQVGAQVTSPNLAVGGVSTVTFWGSASTTSGSVQVNYSTDGGTSWNAASGSPFSLTTGTAVQKTATINSSSQNIIIQLYRTAATVYIDDIVINTSEPTTQASSIVFSSISSSSITATWTNGNGGRRAVFMKDGSGSITNPNDGTAYTASSDWNSNGTQLGSSGYYCIYNGTGNSVSLTNLVASNSYYFQVFEYNSNNNSTPTAAAINYLTTTATDNPNNQATTPAGGGPTVPVLGSPTATSIATTSATLGVTVTSDGGAALLERGTVWGIAAVPTGNSAAEGGTSVSTFTHSRTSLTANTLYTYRGYATNSAGTGYSSDGTFTTLPLAPTVGTGNSITSSGFTANWSHPTMGSASYTYSVEVDDNSDFSSITTTLNSISSSNTSQAITGLSTSTTYYYRVKAINAQGSSDWSSTSVGVTTSAAPCLSENFETNNLTNWNNAGGTTGGGTTTINGTSGDYYLNLNENGEWAQLPSSQTYNSITFNLKGSASSNAWNLKVQTSSDGTTWNDEGGAGTIAGNSIGTTYALQTVTLSSITNFVRLFLVRTSNSCYVGNIDAFCTSVPEINIKQSSTNLANGSGSYSFGTVTTGSSSSAITFTLENTGTATMNLTGTPKVAISGHTSDFTIDQTSTSSTVAAGGNTSFTITFSPTSTGARSATLSIANDDSNENPYTFTVTGTGSSPIAPEINIKQTTTDIASGGSFGFGNVLSSSSSSAITFTIENTGNTDLNLTGTPKIAISGTNAAEFSINQTSTASPVSQGSSTTFIVTFSPISTGSKSATITIVNDDIDESMYAISLSGTGIMATQPTAQPTAFTLISVSTTTMTISWTAATGNPDGYLVLRTSASGATYPDTNPVDGTTYSAGNTLGNATVEYVGSNLSAAISSLAIGSQYSYEIYSYNGIGNSINYLVTNPLQGRAFTLSNEPTSHAANFTATATSATNIDLNFSASSTLPASGYLILKKSTPFVSSDYPIDGNAYGVGTAVGPNGAIVNTVVTSNTTTTSTGTGVIANTTYYYLLVPFNWDGSNSGTRNYFTDITIPTANATTPSGSSDVIAVSASESATISSLVNDAAPLTSTSGIQVWQFTIRDGGAAGDADALPTIVSSITFTQRTTNAIDTWNDAIKTIALFDGTTILGTGTVISNQVQFNGLNINVPDNNSTTLTIRLSLNCPINNSSQNKDGDDFVFQLSNANISTTGTSSSFSSFSAIYSNDGSNVLDVVATTLSFTQQPTNTGVSLVMSPNVAVAAVDACGNIDLGFAGTITISSSGIMSGSSISISAVSGVATFTSIIHTSVGVGYNLSSSSNGLASSISANFDIIPITFFKPGEVAILGFNVDVDGSGTDEISFVSFVDFTSGTTLDITDNPYEKCGTTDGWGISEGWVRLKRINSTLPAGKVVTFRITNGIGTVISPNDGNWIISNPAPAGQGTFNLNSNGEQIFLLQGGTVNGPGAITATSDEGRYTTLNILFGFNTKGNIWTPVCGNSSAGGTQNSAKPRFLDCFMVWPSTTADFNKYKGPISSTSVRLWIERINDPSNWQNYIDNTNYVANTGGGYDYVNYNGSFLGMDITITSGAFDAGKWVGSTNTDWFECSNWQNLKVPDSTINVNIDNVNNDPIIGAINSNFPNGAFCNDLSLTNTNGPSSLNLNTATSILTIKGNVTNDGSISATNGSLQFRSSNTQTYSGTGISNLFDIWLNNTHSNSLTLNQDITYSNNFYFSNGILTINSSNKLISTNTTPPSIYNFNPSKFINGKFRQYITANESSYPLPIGYSNSSIGYHPANFLNGNISGVNYIDASVNTINETGNNVDINLNTMQQGEAVIDVIITSEWNIIPNTNPSSGNYGVDLFVTNMNMTASDDNKFVVVKRANNSISYADWNTFEGTTFIPSENQAGRVTNSGNGFARRTNFTSFSKFAIGKLNNSVLPITVYDFKVNRISKSKNLLEWKSNDEENLLHYELEKSEDGFNYQTLNFAIPLEENNYDEKHYFITDSTAIHAANYYKLFSIDNNGKRLYHDIAFINELKSNEDFSIVYSNDGVTVLIDEEGDYTDALIYSSMGQLIKKFSADDLKTRSIPLNNSEFATGIYFIQVNGKNKCVSIKLIFGQ